MTITPEIKDLVLAKLAEDPSKPLRQIAEEIENISYGSVRTIAANSDVERPFQGETPSQRMIRLRANKKFRENHEKAMEQWRADPINAAASSKRMRDLNDNSKFQKKQAEAVSASWKRLKDDPQFAVDHAAAVSEGMKRFHAKRKAQNAATAQASAPTPNSHNRLGLDRVKTGGASPAFRQQMP